MIEEGVVGHFSAQKHSFKKKLVHSFSVTAIQFMKYILTVSLKYAFIKYAKALISAKKLWLL